MPSETITLFKLMVLYMLKLVHFPLSNSQMSGFFLDKYYTDYFTFQQVVSGLLESSLIRMEKTHNATLYEITKEGEEVLFYFENRLSDSVRRDIEEFLDKNSYEIRKENSILADYSRLPNGEYEVHLEVREGRHDLIDLKLYAAGEDAAEQMCESWQDKSEEIYGYLIRELLE